MVLGNLSGNARVHSLVLFDCAKVRETQSHVGQPCPTPARILDTT